MNAAGTSKAGFFRLSTFVVILPIVLLVKGGHDLHRALKNRTPFVTSYENYVKTQPKALWLVLTNCALDLGRSCYEPAIGQTEMTKLYVPLTAKAGSEEPVRVLLATTDTTLIATAQEVEKLKSDAEVERWGATNAHRLFPRRNVAGLVQTDLDIQSTTRNKLASLVKGADFIILAEGEQPTLGAPIGMFVSGLALFVIGAVVYKRPGNRTRTAADKKF